MAVQRSPRSPSSKTTNGERLEIWPPGEDIIHQSPLVEKQWFWVDTLMKGKSVFINLFIYFNLFIFKLLLFDIKTFSSI